ncbi:NFX1-type zinc finger-containing protein 1-like [Xenia sp. Carnegie-2017]|uniref:NFX1-type zinc finger-containing protein 1-like n=1 Tax=Xenia sp. Carnegie-2017 TaxID=2897299 RepID=UPI001F0404B7|nr:NFX1-type zinc finger-containing protein 1-like [Xenia sp. Carnegie-2017]XP_046846174.1 NFX1-type zinc finger-containing protein 1-like [Xenia sp. Carnegie-2017]
MPRKKKNGGLRGKRKRKRPQFTNERKVILTSSTHDDHDDYTCEEDNTFLFSSLKRMRFTIINDKEAKKNEMLSPVFPSQNQHVIRPTSRDININETQFKRKGLFDEHKYFHGKRRKFGEFQKGNIGPNQIHHVSGSKKATSNQDSSSTAAPSSFSCLKSLCDKTVSPEDASSRICEETQLQRFEALLHQSDLNDDMMKLVLSVIYKVCKSTISKHQTKVFAILNKERVFWNNLMDFVGKLEKDSFHEKNSDISSIIRHVATMFKSSLDLLPELYSRIPFLQLKNSVSFLKENSLVSIDSTLDNLLSEVEKKYEQVRKKTRENKELQAQPPEDFRSLNVFPTAEDIFKKPFLRKNIIKLSFTNVDHYLDVHFRLLKEDSLADLRNGILELRKRFKHKQYGQIASTNLEKNYNSGKSNVVVFHKVSIKDNVQTNSRSVVKGLVYNVSFDVKHPSVKFINWSRSKRLLFGSLVCLISNDFRKLHFATVQDRDSKMLEQGVVQVCFEKHDCPDFYDLQDEYQMVESSSAYFVAYRHILERLQQLSEENMPFQKYIVSCKQQIDMPAYLKMKPSEEKNPLMINLNSARIKKLNTKYYDSEEESRKLCVNPHDLSTWPDGDVIGLNKSQYEAFRWALRREFVVIQGPPGTGKTYLGLKIAHTLLNNDNLWKKSDERISCPILMLAYTNHALDSFLEGLDVDSKDIIRVGGRSSNEVLKQCNINNVRRERRQVYRDNNVRRRGRKRFREVEMKKHECQERLSRLRAIYTKSFQGILPAREFRQVMSNDWKHHFENENMIQFLGINLKPAIYHQIVDNYDEYYGDETGGYFYTGNMEDEDKQSSSEDTILLCSAEETTHPDGLLDLLKNEQETNENLHDGFPMYYHGDLPMTERWTYYLHWLSRLRQNLPNEIAKEQSKYLELSTEYEEMRNVEDLAILQSCRVVGMTTTCASKKHNLLSQLQPRVVIIEEAAELFEAHIIACLTQHCQHLILIGDHQQLRPNPSVYKLGKQYSLDVSLMERMIETGVPYSRLSVQHRMRPEISNLFRHIYENLEDHESVNEYENIRGVEHNLYFIDHDQSENVHDNVHSKVNHHEAKFMAELALYFMKQGYLSSKITILTTYKGQMFVIRDLMKTIGEEYESDMPRVACVDNYQGEENDIILLSLVRNNQDEDIGFLKTDNRVCVSLSRARKALYIIGNSKILSKQSLLWEKIVKDLRQNHCLGPALALVCSNHQTKNFVRTAEDFKKLAPNGGCLEKCEHRLDCGHACPQMCHPSSHDNYKCMKPCRRNVADCEVLGHQCTKLCHEICDQNCKYPVEKRLNCGHWKTLPCSEESFVNFVHCEERCEKTLACGHRCQAKCSKPCTKDCQELVKKTDFSCGHENTMACSATQKDCNVPCEAILECGHPCKGKCGQCIQGRVHVKCKEKCDRNLVCSHQCKSFCSKNCPPCERKCERHCIHSKCQKKCGEVCVPCKESCEWKCEHLQCTKLCSDICNRPRCNEPCYKNLKCGHKCRSLCGEPCVCVVCDKNNDNDVTDILFGNEDADDARFIKLSECDHIFEQTGMDKYMDGQVNNEIKPKVCPLCRIPIMKSLRYGNILKTIQNDIDVVKKEILGNRNLVDALKTMQNLLPSGNILDELLKCPEDMLPNNLEELLKKLKVFMNKKTLCENDMMLLSSEILLINNWRCVSMHYWESLINFENRSAAQVAFEREMQFLLSKMVVVPNNTSTRILNDLNLELQRLSLKRDLLILKTNCNRLNITLDEDDEDIVKRILNALKTPDTIKENSLTKFKKGVADIFSRYPQLTPITQEERVEIVSAMGFKQGHWFKCSCSFIYAIGECGGAMEESKCPDCGATIGGQQHRLADNNELAPEMDGATHPAWSDRANMANYQLD